ncbi:helix-turn-helix domain-containing protein [Aurantiacibacter sp. D1-12]|uniref:helix-turn-helix domain-containing protein n=1 Tax=Aurantiacibacter sp. D1-12 TaxID=2993658 RepID=UPI00237CB5A5|nr:helix-turn-helix domain-containing protein [Aurantiacibacter sp. D1-12]MDE1467471.1 helix-turn-helix domain-containing protein [Aurantiacibacter sp. D1-12]
MVDTLLPKRFIGSCCIERTGSGFTAALRRATLPPQEIPEHKHVSAHLVLAIDEGYLSRAKGAANRSRPMTLVYNPSNMIHRDCFSSTGSRFLSIDLEPHLLTTAHCDPIVVETSSARFAAARIAGILSMDYADNAEIEDLLLAIVAGLESPPTTSRTVPAWLKVASEALTDLASDSGLQIRDIAQAVGVHPVHFARTYRAHFGLSPGAALRQHRLANAVALMTKNQRLAEVAVDAGFADQSHMTRAFRRDYSTTPARFRSAFE